MKKNSLSRILYIGSLLLSLSACDKELTTAPTTAVPESLLYNTTDNIETVLNGTWSYMSDTYFTYANPGYSSILRTSDAMGNDVAVLPSKYGYRDAYPFTEMIDNSKTRVNAFWTILYRVINNCNNVISKVDAAEGAQQEKDRIKGQALALRANSYLTLATFYQFSYLKDPNAKAVPLYTEPTSPQTVGKPKATLKEIYDVILSDLSQAETLLANYKRPAGAKYKINTDVVRGLLARAYLNTGRWAEAAEKAAAARAGYGYMTSNDYYSGFNDLNNAEWIWGHGQTTEQNVASYSFHYLDVSSASSYYYSFMADPYFMTLFSAGDIRKQLFLWDGLPGREGYLRYQKFKFRSNQTADIVLMRSSEMTLIEAEGNARSNRLPQAVQKLNELRAARNAALLDIAGQSQQAIVDTILVERRKELWGEGFSLSDILRTQSSVTRKAYVTGNSTPIAVSVTAPDGTVKQVEAKGHTSLRFPDKTPFSPNSPYYLFAIPQNELNNNPNLNN